MKKWTLKDIIEICDGRLLTGNDNIIWDNYSKDTRTLAQNDIYIGIKGENFDGNSFYKEAFDKGAAACILDKEFEKQIDPIDKPIIIVDNTTEALAKLASKTLEVAGIPVIAITGSVGKTSTKDMIHAVLSKKYKTLKTEGNYNNAIGLPLTVLKLQDEECAVIEMGMNALGEISYLSKLTKPDIAVITNVAPSHIGLLGTMENILKAKLEIIDGLKENGILIINNDNEYLRNANVDTNKFTFSIKEDSDLVAYDLEINNTSKFKVDYESNTYEFEININTESFVLNALAAIAVGIKMNVPVQDIIDALKHFHLTGGRLEILKLDNQIQLINDAYNANTTSMKNGLDFLCNNSGNRKIAILGDMRELGDYAIEMHREVGEYVASKNIDFLIAIGSNSKYYYEYALRHGMSPHKIKYFEDKNTAYPFIKAYLRAEDLVLLKASNGEKFSEIIEEIKRIV